VKPIPLEGFDGYFATEDGFIYSDRQSKRILKGSPDKDGYIHVSLSRTGRRHGDHAKHFPVHVLVALAYLGPRTGPEARHLDGNNQNNRPDNLAWGTRLENGADKVAHGRSTKGVRNCKAKLNPNQVLDIRALVIAGARQRQVARKFAISPATVYAISCGAIWRED
jgi:hypothetical protein